MLRILLVDESSHSRSALQFILQANGFDVVCVPNATNAWQAAGAAERPFDLLIASDGLPDMPVFELASRIRAGKASLPILILRSSRSTRRTTLKKPPSILDTPFNSAEFLISVNKALAD